MDIGEIIRERRVELKVTQTELARRLGISRNQVSNVETGKSLPSAKVLTALEEALETSFFELLSEPTPTPAVWLTRRPATGPEVKGKKAQEQLLATGPGDRLMPLRVRLAPRARWEPGVRMKDCSEHFVYVIAGGLEGLAEGRWFPLALRHAIYIKGVGPAVWRNPADEPAEFLWVGGQ